VRADAQRNRERLLEAAIEMILEVGGEPSRDAIARRAGVGVATLYRHFPDQQSLLTAVAHHVLDRSAAAAEAALSDAPDGAEALRGYMHAAVDMGLGVLNLIYPLLDDPRWPARRARAEALLQSILDRAGRDHLLRDDTSTTDIGFAVIRFCRPLAVGRSLDDERSIAHRHVDVYVDGLTKLSGRSP
jgi:AcrR family transcriptional regulator